jgi:hypothetical protein
MNTREEMRAIAARNYRHWTDHIARTDGDFSAPRGLRHPRDKCAVIVEARPHPHLGYVMRNVMHFLDDSWGLCVVHGGENRTFVEELVRGWGDVMLIDAGVASIDTEGFNELLTRPSFWEQLPSETILMFQTDSILRRRGIDAFLEFDYVGAPWMHALLSRDDTGPVGNGGLSLRKKRAMLEILARHEREPDLQEDQYFSRWLYRDGYRMPSLTTASLFSTETIFQPESLGLHKAWLYHFERPFLDLLNGFRESGQERA